MALELYRQKRNFSATAEPAGSPDPRGEGQSFVVQKHDARRLHYDFRLEMGGVLKSWAVTRGPSLVPGEKRLAVHVEDHPLEYGDFEGTIPKGEYGGGTVIVWDHGTWSPVYDAEFGYKKGHLQFELHGEKLHGLWHLVRMHGRPREKHENWLLIKAEDDYARHEGDPDILEELPTSAKTGRNLAAVAQEAPGWSSKTGKIDAPVPEAKPAPKKSAAKPKKPIAADPMPEFVAPALASLAANPPAGAKYLHEIKFDGYRLQARIEAGKTRLLTRSGLDWTEKFGPAIAGAFAALPCDTALIDGELVVEGDGGAPDFSRLQADLSEGRGDRFRFYAFDLLYLDGGDLRAAKLTERKARLQTLLQGAPEMLRLSESFDADGAHMLRQACQLSLEGVVSKLRDAPYRSGRNKDWIKSKCSARQEFVVAGYVVSTVSNQAIGSLVLGYYEDGTLVHAGRVGTGFTQAVARDLFARLQPSTLDKSPFGKKLPSEAAHGVQFVAPTLVAEVEFAAWTADRLVRHAAFRGLREDKAAAEVVEESTAAPAAKPAIGVKLTHPDRVYWPDVGVTKQGLAEYYAEIWPFMAPHVAGRPLSLVRCPEGLVGQCFFQKHAWKGLNKAIRQWPDPKSSGEPILAIDDLDGLIALVQSGVMEIHPWGSTLHDLERPDTIIMDLDPAEDVGWPEIVSAAEEVRLRLKSFGLAAFVKTSGGKGLHVVSPIAPRAGWDETKKFTKAMADAMTRDSPDRYVAVVTKARRHGKILIDYLRNGRGATAVAPYSTRARASAAVSMPVDWDELRSGIGPAYFTVANAVSRLSRQARDPWADFRERAAEIKTG